MFLANELSWSLSDSGFFAKAGLGMYVPTGTLQGPAGLSNVGDPWWTFQPNLVFSYLKDGWNLTVNVFDEINTANSRTNYRSGDVLHAEFTATKTIGKWTFGPVAYYAGQISDDRSSAFYGGAINVNRYNIWAAGGVVGYDFGPASISVWGTRELSSTAAGALRVLRQWTLLRSPRASPSSPSSTIASGRLTLPPLSISPALSQVAPLLCRGRRHCCACSLIR